jgi:hypothetical protein
MRFPVPAAAFGLLLSAGLVCAQSSAPLAAGAAHFAIYQGDKSVGSADRTIAANPNGYSITSQGKMSLSKFSYSYTDTQHIDKALNLVHDQLNGTVNGKPVTFSAQADSSGRQFQININAEGKDTQNTVDRHQHMALLPDLDPAAYTLMVQIGAGNPQTSWILIPKDQGFIVPSTYTRDGSVRGRLNGAQVDVQHLTVTVGEQNPVSVELYYGRDSDLLEADLPEQNFFVVRDGFKLIDRPAAKPPQGQAPPPQNGQPQSPNSQGAPQYPAPQGGYPQMQPQ